MKHGRTLLIVVLIVALLVTASVQKLALGERNRLLRTTSGVTAQASLATMDSYSLALLLGGLRGPLVMFLWMQSETQKQSKDLEGVETQIEWIRLLQPEFDTVHLFQIWNKAYNISVQMASLANKYSVILDAMQYAHNVETQRPEDLNIMTAMANLFNDKLGGSNEKAYYRERIRQDSLYRAPEPQNRLAGSRPMRFESVLDQQGNIRPEFLKPRLSLSSATTAPDGEKYDGSQLQYLKQYEPYPYGITPRAFAYNYYRRAQQLQLETGQHPLQMAPMVVDSRPGLTLRAWTDEEWEAGSQAEDRLMGQREPEGRLEALLETANLNPLKLTAEQVRSRKADLDKAIYHYGLTMKLANDAEASFKKHLANPEYQMHVDMYRSHLDHLNGVRMIMAADSDVLKAVTASGSEREALTKEAILKYNEALRIFRIVRLRFYVADSLYPKLFPVGIGRWNMEKATDDQLAAANAEVGRKIKEQGYDINEDDTKEYMSYVSRCLDRIEVLSK